MRVTALVVDERPLPGRVLDVLLGDRAAFGPRGLDGELEDVQRVPGIAAGAQGDELDELGRHLGLELVRSTPHDDGQILPVQRLELVDLGGRATPS